MKPFFDTNILVYALSADPKRTRAQQLLDGGGVVSVQVLNELTNVLCKKLRRTWPEIEAALDDLCDLLEPPTPLSVATHQSARWLARDHGFGFYDALIVAAAIEAGCDTLFSEDMQNGRRIASVGIVNPFT